MELSVARLLEFDETRALSAAMHAFRRLGYHGVSIKTLEAETGLSSGSIYNSFGGKNAVFQRVLSHYNDTVVDKRISEHLSNAEPIEGLITLFESLLDEPDDAAFGCLLTNSAIEFSGSDTIASAEIRQGFERFLSAFRTALMTVRGADPDAVGRTSLRLLAYYQGLLVLIRHGYDKATLRDTIKSEIKDIIGDLDA
jgi:AcrR family transcriptional regulator